LMAMHTARRAQACLPTPQDVQGAHGQGRGWREGEGKGKQAWEAWEPQACLPLACLLSLGAGQSGLESMVTCYPKLGLVGC
jgi:hypothetical protein